MEKIIKYSGIFFITLCFVILNFSFTYSQDNKWEKWDYLVGYWVGDNNGEPGAGTGYFTFRKELDNKILTRRSHTEFPAKEQEPKLVHDDLMIIYFDNNSIPGKAIYFDNENHVINYSVTYDDITNSVILTSEPLYDKSIVRFTYTKIDENNVKAKFEISPTGQTDAFRTHLEGNAHKQNNR